MKPDKPNDNFWRGVRNGIPIAVVIWVIAFGVVWWALS